MKIIGFFVKDIVVYTLVAMIIRGVYYVCDETVLYDYVFRSLYWSVPDVVYECVLLTIGTGVGIIVATKLNDIVSKFKIIRK